MDARQQRLLEQIEGGLAQSDPGLARKLQGRQLERNCPEAVAWRENLKISLVATLAGLFVIALALALFLLYVHFNPIHTPDMPYGHMGG